MTKYFDNLMTEKNKRIEDLEREVISLRDRIDRLEDVQDDNAAYMRRESLVMSGGIPNGTRDENCKTIVVELLRSQVRLNLDINDISIAHRIGRKKQQGIDNRNIFFKLCRRDLKYDILHACRQYRPKFYINESLTPTRNKTLYILRQVKKKFPRRVRTVRTNDGSVTAFLATDDAASANIPLAQLRKVTVNTLRQLQRLLREEFDTDLEKLGYNWNVQ